MAVDLCSRNVLRYLKVKTEEVLVFVCPNIAVEYVKIYWPSKKGIRELGFTLNLTKALKHLNDVRPDECLIDEISKLLLERSKTWLVSLDQCSLIDRYCLLIKASAVQMTSRIFLAIHSLGSNYGKQLTELESKKEVCILIPEICQSNNPCNLSGIRTAFLTVFVQRILEFSGNSVLRTISISNQGETSTICDERCEPDIDRRKATMKCSLKPAAPSLQPLNDKSASEKDEKNVLQMSVLLGQYVEDNSTSIFSTATLPKTPISLVDDSGRPTDLLCQAAYVDHVIQQHSDLTHIAHGTVSCKTSSDGPVVLAKDLYRLKFAELKTCFAHKYNLPVGGTGDSESKLDAMFSTFTDFCIKFELLQCTISNNVSLKYGEGEARCKSGVLVMYGYARITSLLQKYETQVEKGYYPSLSEIDSTNFSVLKKEEEKNLVVLCGQYPSVIEDVSTELMLCLSRSSEIPAVHKIIRYLTDLSQDLSIFYSRIHVLGEPVPQMMPSMFARLWLLKSVKQVMENIFSLLDVVPIHQL